MDDVTDTVFRQIVNKHAPADIYFTEFANADGMQSPGRDAVEKKLVLEKSDRPIIAQIWGKNPEAYKVTARELAQRGFDGIDINMGCPVRAVVKNGCCSALIEDRELAGDLIDATKEGIAESGVDIPLSVKTRLGYSEVQTEDWCRWLLERDIAALTVHGRIAVEMSKFPADWGEIAKVAEMRNSIAPNTVVVGNGDVLSRAQGEELARTSGVDGVMVGRGVFRDPWIFNPKMSSESTPSMRIDMLLLHLQLWQQTWSDEKNFEVMKKFFKMYISEWEGSSRLRADLMEAKSVDSVIDTLNKVKADVGT